MFSWRNCKNISMLKESAFSGAMEKTYFLYVYVDHKGLCHLSICHVNSMTEWIYASLRSFSQSNMFLIYMFVIRKKLYLPSAKVSCILRHRGVQLILAYSWARPAILVAGKGRWGIFLFLLFLHFHSCSFLPCPSL